MDYIVVFETYDYAQQEVVLTLLVEGPVGTRIGFGCVQYFSFHFGR